MALNGLTLKSGSLAQTLAATSCYIDSYFKMSFSEIVNEYYYPVRKLLNDSLMVSAEIMLTEADMCNFDFKKLYYIRQLSNYFLVNKINNYIPGKPTKCELVRVLYTATDFERKPLRITKVIVTGQTFVAFYENNTDIQQCNLVAECITNMQHSFTTNAVTNPAYASSTPPGNFLISITAGEHVSNKVEISLYPESSQIITPYS